MASISVGPVAAPGAVGGLAHRGPDREDVVAVDGDAGHAVGRGLGGDLGIEGDAAERRGRGVEVVLADEDRRRALHGGEVQRLVEGAVVGGAVAEEGDADIVAAAAPGGEADADGVADAGADDAVGAEQADAAVIEVHGAAAAAADAVGLAEELGHDPAGIGALGQRVAVAAVGGGDPVGRAEVGADADAGGLLADIEVEKAGRLAAAAGGLGDGLEAAEEHHLLEEGEEDFGFGEVARRTKQRRRLQGICFQGVSPREKASVRALVEFVWCRLDYNSIRSSAKVRRAGRRRLRLTAAGWYR